MESISILSANRGTGRGPSRGERTRQGILQTAVDIASAEGLEGLSIGRLAQELKMSKSGLIAHFGTKEGLQLATLDMARAIFMAEVVEPAVRAERGLARLQAMLECWLSYVERGVFRGGCFFAAVSAEYDDRAGAVRDQVATLTKAWLDALEDEIRQAQTLSQLVTEFDSRQLAFEVHAFVQEANWAYRLLRNKQAFKRARVAIRQRLESVATPEGLSIHPIKPTTRKKAKSKESNQRKGATKR